MNITMQGRIRSALIGAANGVKRLCNGSETIEPESTIDMMKRVACGIKERPAAPIEPIAMLYVNRAVKSLYGLDEPTYETLKLLKRRIAYEGKLEYDDIMQCGVDADRKLNGNTATASALPRIIYPAIYYRNENDAVQAAQEICSMTHRNPTAMRFAREFAGLLHKITEEDDITKRKHSLYPYTYYEDITNDRRHMSDYVVDAYMAAITFVRDADSYLEALELAAEANNEENPITEPIAAAVGALAGAVYGFAFDAKADIETRLTALEHEELSALSNAAYKSRKKDGGKNNDELQSNQRCAG